VDPAKLPPLPQASREMTAAEFAATHREPQRHRSISTPQRERDRLASEVANFIAARDWSRVTVGHAVSLYCWCHGQVYRVEPAELQDGREFALATFHVRRFVDQQFRGNLEELIRYVQWAFKREQGREKWRLETGKESKRLLWRWCFSPSLVTDYRLFLAQEAKQGR